MRSRAVGDWLPSRPVADRGVVPTGPARRIRAGVGFTPIVAVKSGVPLKGGKSKVKNLSLPVIHNGPLSQRAGKTKTIVQGIRGVGVMGYSNGVGYYGVRGSKSAALYSQAWTQAKTAVIDSVTSSQAALDKIDSALIGVDSQIQALRDGAGPSAPGDVLSVIDGAASSRRDLGDQVDGLRATIDSMNAAAASAAQQASAGSPAQQALDKAYQTSKTMAAQITQIQRAVSQTTAKTEAATQAVNRYVDGVNAQAASLVQQQAQQAAATDIAYGLTDQQKALAQAQADQAQRLRDAQAARDAEYAKQLADAKAAQDAQLAQMQRDYQNQLQQQLYSQMQQQQQQQYQSPPQQFYAPPPPPPQQYYQTQYYPPPPQQPLTYEQDNSSAVYTSPQSGFDFDGGPMEADASWATYVEGTRGAGVGATLGAPPSGSALASAEARRILADANLKIADARKQIEQQALREAAKATGMATATPPSGIEGWSPLKKGLAAVAAVVGGVKLAQYLGGHK